MGNPRPSPCPRANAVTLDEEVECIHTPHPHPHLRPPDPPVDMHWEVGIVGVMWKKCIRLVAVVLASLHTEQRTGDGDVDGMKVRRSFGMPLVVVLL